MNIFAQVISLLIASVSLAAPGAQVDCTEAYGGKRSNCVVIKCDAKYSEFLGKWTGPFSSYVRELSMGTQTVFRPFQNAIAYSENDCLKNQDNGDTFIIGRRTDTYPAFRTLPARSANGLLITGKKADGTPFLRTVDEDGTNAYTLIYQNIAASMSVWSLLIPANGKNPEMRFTAIDGKDFSETENHKRNVTVTMSVGPATAPYWEGVVSSGFHINGK